MAFLHAGLVQGAEGQQLGYYLDKKAAACSAWLLLDLKSSRAGLAALDCICCCCSRLPSHNIPEAECCQLL